MQKPYVADKCFCTEVSSWHDMLLLSTTLYDIVILYWCEPTADDVATAGVVEVSLYKWMLGRWYHTVSRVTRRRDR